MGTVDGRRSWKKVGWGARMTWLCLQNKTPNPPSIPSASPAKGKPKPRARATARCGRTGSRSDHLRSRPRLYGALASPSSSPCATSAARARATPYYRHLRLLADIAARSQPRSPRRPCANYFLHVKTIKGWNPKTIRQAPPAPASSSSSCSDTMPGRSSRRCGAPKTSIPSRRSSLREEIVRLLTPHSFAALPAHQLN